MSDSIHFPPRELAVMSVLWKLGSATVTQVKDDLDSLKPLVQDVFYESSTEAYARFKEQFKNSPIAQNASPDALPESFRVKLSDPTKYDVIASSFVGRPGVDNVVDQRSLLDKFFQVLGGLQKLALLIAGAMILVLAVVNHCGSWLWVAWPLISARAGRPSRSTSERLARISAAAPSALAEEAADRKSVV